MSKTSQIITRELDYYELYLLDYLRQHKFPQQHDRDFIRARADEAAETYEQERRNGHSTDQAQELAMTVLTKGLHYLPFMGKVFSIYDLADDDFALSDEYQNLHDELTGAVALYLGQYGIQ